jgi:hypothetical protein
MLQRVQPAIIAREPAHELNGATDHFIEVLDHQVIDLLYAEEVRLFNS